MLARRSLLAARTFAAPLRQRTPLFLSARNLSTATAPLSQSTSTTTQYTQPEAAEPEFDLAGRREKWYHIMRTRQGELPVYAKYRNDGGCKTIVRKIEGDSHTLKDQLNEWFEQSHLDPFTRPPQATVKPTNGEVQIKGHWVEEIKDFLSDRGF
ncbi:hypothetical protein CNBC1930 [Cryptococcus deneoformans B-3501A]|uniref:Large ribosomal subunit protein mL49 n=1 Tax=Cryptococcus deneoformans (strain JEC21 / ATCC MYA-565) TaxID=214684 RepID=Q5KJV4_CRYD1|nr:hypothetical protein CNC05240 [Cryptococcus neoformans var. neoformans JEC21]XP_776702.1 hypothetical protein CNBC1930 [Cryptococcus neoformans var. neoformans B-3501A]AAW42404.1 hypothetical protein CNC05240 [Cryptococcus neoformans var. neoformans JEC21]EAL22055.1 hypothetical protein CNBC1930 [Cryptococcus neoformans var. neoformans B-3501A]